MYGHLLRCCKKVYRCVVYLLCFWLAHLLFDVYVRLILSLTTQHNVILFTLILVLSPGDTFRYDTYDCSHHMGLGAASHMSSVAEPAEYWLKRGSVIEQVVVMID